MELWNKFKTFCEGLTAGYAPWWVVPVAIAVVLAVVF